ncbi:ATPase, T2SS/T4P/T4SS family [Paraclostridium bifermentans]|uniref:ATPase, T2SS/T4P/T4SS family n=1 Tax=Paraclostridium bifermentans TaxID=1490 RepID=UPI00374EC8C8
MLDLKHFALSDDLNHLFKIRNITDLEEITYMIEQYCILSRAEIVNILCGHTKHSYQSVKRINPAEEFTDIAAELNFIPEIVDDNTINIYYNGFYDLDRDRIESTIYTYANMNYIAMTPYNFAELTQNIEEIDCGFLSRVLVSECVKYKGSDIHITCGYVDMKPKYWVDFRVDNRIVEFPTVEMDAALNKKLIFSIVNKQSNANQNDIDYTGVSTCINDPLENGKYTLRLTANRTICGYNCVTRIQKMNTVSLNIDELGFDNDATLDLTYLANKSSGITLITGPIRSGKNTTAFALANSLLEKPLRLVDYSSPVETLMPFPQVDFGGSIDSLIDCIKNTKKQDVDLAFINEIPSRDVAFAVRELVNSSVGVITTMHIDRIWHIPHKLYEYYGDSYKDVISQINAVCNQKMFVKQCQDCAQAAHVTSLQSRLQTFLNEYNVSSYYSNTGCPKCVNGSIPGAVQPYVEILIFTEEVKKNLLALDHPYEMSNYIYETMMEREASLEYKVANAVRLGKVVVDSLYTIV